MGSYFFMFTLISHVYLYYLYTYHNYITVCTSLIANGERQEEDNIGGRIRMQALSMLCQMNPVQALAIRSKCVSIVTEIYLQHFLWY